MTPETAQTPSLAISLGSLPVLTAPATKAGPLVLVSLILDQRSTQDTLLTILLLLVARSNRLPNRIVEASTSNPPVYDTSISTQKATFAGQKKSPASSKN